MICTATALVFAGILFLALAAGFSGYSAGIWHSAKPSANACRGERPPKARRRTTVLWRDRSLSTIHLLDRLLQAIPRVSDVQLLLLQASDPCNMGALVLMKSVTAFLGCLMGLWRDSGLMALILAAVGAVAPLSWLHLLRKKRLQAFDEQLPEAVEMMASASRAGHVFASALHMVGEERDDSMAGQFTKAFKDFLLRTP
ncbi:hypothetical protein DFAR_1830012 [Desulfarculales bacterium]